MGAEDFRPVARMDRTKATPRLVVRSCPALLDRQRLSENCFLLSLFPPPLVLCLQQLEQILAQHRQHPGPGFLAKGADHTQGAYCANSQPRIGVVSEAPFHSRDRLESKVRALLHHTA